MGKKFSIEQAASSTAIQSKPSILAKIFKNLVLSQFRKINHGCIILNEGNENIIFGDQGSSLKAEYSLFLIEIMVLIIFNLKKQLSQLLVVVFLEKELEKVY